MQNRDELKLKILPIIEEALNLTQPITDTTLSFKEDLKADSIDIVSLAMLLEEELDIDIEDNLLDQLRTIDDVILFVEEYT